ncbi:MAG: NADH-quinone oxidoreductase subunit C [Betaproteobacteria bacterium]|jgi:NADH-quinone oxidoreductase subunit C|nr:NADH-quinone oxidoreductase subunit C [Betaproteobacteria bacterium]NBP38330.1 NADH-quinone oxidoreductase subunit C [Betaproteobacteria bacterium]NBQ78550.1 NADH-quinone oxidoreductase subunit C [Betaproteobacteria bacterium]NBQ95227.1 NADH-quinone oxidoreductase subunit C [Betaproteobacteria bacterium]NBS39296.1 NADH-quinone oxidoreductase subunit C [Betaproteobacteria bacterium]
MSSPSLDALKTRLEALFEGRLRALVVDRGEISITVASAELLSVAILLRDDPALRFDTLIDLCGVDYMNFANAAHEGLRFAVVNHLLSVQNNLRLRLKVFATDEDFPVVPSLTGVWPSAGWYEREAFDLYGIVFDGHSDLRRILTDYGFVGHPFRKDFPVSGYVEMRYDPEQQRVIYQPVSIEPRENVPRVVREDGYGVGRN